MLETFNIFWAAPIELRVIILGIIVMGIYLHFKDVKEKRNEKDY